MQVSLTLSNDQVSYLVDILDSKKSQREAQINASSRPSSSAKLELLALSDLINKLETAKPLTVQLPALPEPLG